MTANASELFNFFVQTVRQNLHCILCFSPVGEAIRTRLRKFPSLITCMTIDWFPAWPEDALHNVAKSFLSEVQVDPENQDENTQIQVRTPSPFAPFQPCRGVATPAHALLELCRCAFAKQWHSSPNHIACVLPTARLLYP